MSNSKLSSAKLIVFCKHDRCWCRQKARQTSVKNGFLIHWESEFDKWYTHVPRGLNLKQCANVMWQCVHCFWQGFQPTNRWRWQVKSLSSTRTSRLRRWLRHALNQSQLTNQCSGWFGKIWQHVDWTFRLRTISDPAQSLHKARLRTTSISQASVEIVSQMASADKDGALTAADPLARQPDLLDQGARSWKKLEAKDVLGCIQWKPGTYTVVVSEDGTPVTEEEVGGGLQCGSFQ